MPAETLQPNSEEIRRDLVAMTARWHELGHPVMFEIRAFAEGKQPQSVKYAPDWIDDAVEFCSGMNAKGFNIYAVRNPIRQACKGSASDSDIAASFYLWADCDDAAAAEAVRQFVGPKWTMAVTTGTTPSTRVHVYWELAEPCADLAAWRAMQQTIAAFFGSDGSVINPSRIMRVAGTVSWPPERKRGKGYVPELVKLRTVYDDGRGPVTLDQMGRAFGSARPSTDHRPTIDRPSTFEIDTGSQPLDRERLAIQAMQGQEWHNAVIRLVASYVAKGLSDSEIHAMTQPLTLTGYTTDQTAKEVQTAIDGARRKGWTPQAPYASPSGLQTLPQDQSGASFDAPKRAAAVEWFDDIEPAIKDSYLVKGMVSQLAMSCIYGPSNSGKTFFVIDLCFHIAIGATWRKHRVKQAAILYLAAEGGRGVVNRIAALKQEHGILDVPFALHRAGLDLLHEQADLQHIVNLAAEVRTRHPDFPLMLVIDTLSRVMAGGDENSAQDMTALIRNIDALREMIGCHVMLVHHTGKDTARGARGHSSLRAAVDTEIELEVEGESRAALVTKQRDYSGGEVFAFKLKTVVLGVDDDGDDVTSCVVEHIDSAEHMATVKAQKGLGGNQKIIADTFNQMIGEGLGTPNPAGVGFPEPGRFLCVSLDELRRYSTGKMVAAKPRDAFNEAWRALTERGLFCAADGKAWNTTKRISQ